MTDKPRPYNKMIKALMAEKTAVLSKARAMAELGMPEAAETLWAAAASYEERLAPLLDTHGRALEAAVHRVSAASCYLKAGELGRAANLFHAALAGPLQDQTREEVRLMLKECLAELRASPGAADGRRRP